MTPHWNGIEQRLELLKGCLLKLEPLKAETSDEFVSDLYLKDIVERNLEVAAQACIDIANRIIFMAVGETTRLRTTRTTTATGHRAEGVENAMEESAALRKIRK